MSAAARMNDPTGHGKPLNPGPGSQTVTIGFQPAWRAVPSGLGAAIEGASNAMKDFMSSPVLTPADATPKISQIMAKMGETAGKAAAEGNPSVCTAAASSAGTVASTATALGTTWGTASAVPGGQPAANTAYTQGIKAAMAAAATAIFSALGATFDMHICPVPCPIPPHGPGLVTKGSETVIVDNLPLARQGDKVFEACGGEDPIAMGCPTVEVG